MTDMVQFSSLQGASDEAIQLSCGAGLLRGAFHWVAIRPTRWFALTMIMTLRFCAADRRRHRKSLIAPGRFSSWRGDVCILSNHRPRSRSSRRRQKTFVARKHHHDIADLQDAES